MMLKKVWVLLLGVTSALLLTLVAASPFSVWGERQVASSLPLVAPSESQPSESRSMAIATPGLRVIESDETGVTLELITDPAALHVATSPGYGCVLLSLPGYGGGAIPGWPDLPARGAMVGVPPTAEVSVAVVSAETALLTEAYDVCPVATPQVAPALVEPNLSPATRLDRAPDAYSLDRYWPEQLAEVSSVGYVRDQRVAQIELRPVQVVATTGQIRLTTRLVVRVRFSGSDLTGVRHHSAPTPDTAFEPLMANTLVNYDTAKAWRGAIEDTGLAAIQSQTLNVQALAGPAVRIEVDQAGIYAISPVDLEAAGVVTSTIDPVTFRLQSQGQDIAVEVQGSEDGVFGGEDRLIFYGEPVDTRFTDTNVYWLTWGSTPGPSMATRDGAPGSSATTPTSYTTTARWEQNIYYLSSTPSGAAGDHWVGPYIYTTQDPVYYTTTLTLDHVASAPFSATMRGLINGPSQYTVSPDHHTQVYLNGHLVDDAWWDGWRDYRFLQTIPHTYLHEGVNEITLKLPFDLGPNVLADRAFINWYQIDYQRTYTTTNDELAFGVDLSGTWQVEVSGFTTDALTVYDVTSPTHPIRVLNPTITNQGMDTYELAFDDMVTETHRYEALAPAQRRSPKSIQIDQGSDWRSPDHGADYILITHENFYADVAPLAAFRQSQGLRTAIVDVQDIYDEFSNGLLDPEAIRDFLAYAYANWNAPAPSYVVLVGDGHYDFRNYKGYGETEYIPPYLAYADPWIGEVAADNRYVCVNGDDTFPDMYLGRLPARSSADAAAMVTKILAYEQSPTSGDWSRKILFVSDNAEEGDAENDFPTHSDLVADQRVPVPYEVDKAYYLVNYATAADTKAATINAINSGRLMVNYTGHGAIEFWAGEQLLRRSDISAMTNTTRLPFFVPMTCYEGYYITPSGPRDNSAFAEAVVRAAGKGAIASWSPTGLGLASGHDYLHEGLYEALFQDGVDQLGPATLQAKLHLFTVSSGHRELIDTYLLFGDPATRLQVQKTDVEISKRIADPVLGHLTYALIYTNTGPAMAHGVVITDMLPAVLLDPSVISSGPLITARTGTTFSWRVADMLPNSTGRITITARVDPHFEGPLTNTASIAATVVETTTLNNHSEVSLDVVWQRIYLPLATRAAGN